jgi:hypothetical protein
VLNTMCPYGDCFMFKCKSVWSNHLPDTIYITGFEEMQNMGQNLLD